MAMHVLACGMSRSGTTLLTTILDSHPDISMGYELLPVDLPPVADTIKLLDAAIEESDGDSGTCGDLLRAKDFKSLGTFVKRCARTLTTAEELRGICCAFESEGCDSFDGLEMRTRLSLAVVQNKMRKEGTTSCGFKINSPSVSAFDSVIPDGRFIYILRDPRDVVASHFANDFDRTLEHICKAWVNYVEKFDAFAEANPSRTSLVRYEELVAAPEETLARAFEGVGLEFTPEMLRFFDSKASVHRTGHQNADKLKRDFFTTSVARWEQDLSLEQIVEIERGCSSWMERFGYRKAPAEKLEPLPRKLHREHTEHLSAKKQFYRDLYGTLVLPPLEGRVNLTWYEAAKGEKANGKEILILRHDVDHDYETALRMAHWEHEHDLRATYCILHTAWYYGELKNGRMTRSREMLDCCRKLQALGHEINLHNNFVVLALQTGADPSRLLADELLFFRLHGVDIHGTSSHGDSLCRDLHFRNFELFSECIGDRFGGPRTLTHHGRQVELGAVSMSAFGLEYEAYDIPFDRYITDSGHRPRTVLGTRGRAGKRRSEMEIEPPYPMIVGILTHPIWWDFQRDTPSDSAFANIW